MKSTLLTAVLCLILGIAIGWLSKPGPSEAAVIIAEPHSSAPPKASSLTGNGGAPGVASKSIRPPDDQEPGKPAISMGSPNPAMQERFRNMILEQSRKRASDKVTDLSDKLGLNAAQTARLQEYFDNKIAGITGDGDGMPDMAALSKLQSNKSLDEALADILTEDQSAAYEEMKTNERNRKVESRAYKDLARVNNILDLNDDQKNAVYDILYEQAAEKVDNSNDSGSAMAMVMNGHGIDIDVDDLGLGGIIESATSLESNDDSPPASREDLMKRLQEKNQSRINGQVERLAPALTPEQTEQYRKHLESRNSGMFQNMMIEGTDAADAPTAVFKIEPSGSE